MIFCSKSRLLSIFLALALGSASAVATPRLAASQEATTEVEPIIVAARRTDAPIWQIVQDDRTLILVGSISGVPRDLDWRPDALEAAARRSDRILFPQHGRASVSDVLRLIWRIRTIARLPNGTTTADYLDPEDQARLEALMADQRNDRWRTESFVSLSIDLMSDRAGYQRRRTYGATDAIQQAARAARVPVRAVGTVRGDELIDNLITMPPQTYTPCLIAAMDAAEAGSVGERARIEAWRTRRIEDVMQAPVEKALNLCWPWGDPEIAPLLRGQWVDAVNQALSEPGVTMAVVQLRVLAEPDGVLDQLQNQGFEIEGPDWKATPPESQPASQPTPPTAPRITPQPWAD